MLLRSRHIASIHVAPEQGQGMAAAVAGPALLVIGGSWPLTRDPGGEKDPILQRTPSESITGSPGGPLRRPFLNLRDGLWRIHGIEEWGLYACCGRSYKCGLYIEGANASFSN